MFVLLILPHVETGLQVSNLHKTPEVISWIIERYKGLKIL